MLSLYEIDSAILECVDFDTGEIIDLDRLAELEIARDEKIEGICLWIKNLEAHAQALKVEKDSFAHRQKVAENKVASLKNYLGNYLNGAKFESTKTKVGYRKSESVEVAEGAIIPEEFLKHKEPDIDKTGLKKALKSGREIAGVSIVQKLNLQIK